MKMASGHRWELTIEQEWIPITTNLPTPNRKWRHVDASGHEHRYDKGYPTLRLVIDASHWCDGTEGAFRHDPHEQVDESHYECGLCGEVVEPALNPPGTVDSIPGMRSASAIGHVGRMRVSMYLTEEDCEKLAGMDQTQIERFLDGLVLAKPDQIVSSEIRG